MSQGKKPAGRGWYYVILVLGALVSLVSLFLPFPWLLLFLVFGLFFALGSIGNLWPQLLKKKDAMPGAPAAPAAQPPAQAAPPASSVPVDLNAPEPDGYLDGQPFYKSDYEVAKVIHTKVVGVTFKNKDGSSRQEIIAECYGGQQLELEAYTYKGAPAYAVMDGYGGQLGNLSAEIAHTLHDLPDDWIPYVEISEITGGGYDENLGCNIIITLYKKEA